MKFWILWVAVLAIGVSFGGHIFVAKDHSHPSTTHMHPWPKKFPTPKKKSSKLGP